MVKLFHFLKRNLSLLVIFVSILFLAKVDYNNQYWKSNNKIIVWDVISYYGYLPAAVIYKDLKFDFLEEKPELKKHIWVLTLDNGNKLIITSMGMSYLYLPGFLVAHVLAEPLGFDANGYTYPYRISILVSALMFLFLGLYYLRKILLRYTNEFITAIALFSVVFGTNLLYYIVNEPGMTHVYNFALINVFIYFVIKYYETYKNKHLFFLGFLAGLITLIRPTNILVLLIFFFYGITSFNELGQRVLFFLKKIPAILIMIFLFVLPWIPQFLLWKMQTGQFLFFSYGEAGASFFFGNPQTFKFLFSYWKGWLVYTPIMLLAIVGIFINIRKKDALGISTLIFLMVVIYVLSSWWSWWFGGGFGQRSMIDIYGLLMVSLATLLNSLRKKLYLFIPVFSILGVLVWYNTFQFRQYNTGALHYLIMTKEMYWESFLEKYPTDKYREVTRKVDYAKARQGIYELEPIGKKRKPDPINERLLKEIEEILLNDSLKLAYIINKGHSNDTMQLISNDAKWLILKDEKYILENRIYNKIDRMSKDDLIMEQMKAKAEKNKISVDEQLRKDAIWIIEREK